MKVLKRLKDGRYTVIVAQWEGATFLYLKDSFEKTESLGLIEKEKLRELKRLWEEYLRDREFCLPCYLLLLPQLKVLKGENAVAEIGLTLERLEKFKEEVENEGGQL